MQRRHLLCSLFLFCTVLTFGQTQRSISQTVLQDKLHAFWIGQLVGNYMGFPFENVYVEKPIPILVDRYYDYSDKTDSLRLNANDARGFVPILTGLMEGAVSDDDTDIEFTTLHAVEEYGLDITYEEITEVWKKHINRKIWVANRTARNLMEQGLVAPATGSKENNEHWFQIDPQLVNEIWSAFYPGMTKKAVERADWAAHITNDDWGTHPTLAYAKMYSAAFFEKDVKKLVEMAHEVIPEGSPFKEGMADVIQWHQEHDDWRVTRQLIHDNYYRYKKGDYEAPVSIVSSLNNGLCGIMAILYGEGDFLKTVSIATSAGYDCDNQAATCGGLLGVLNGMNGIPDFLKYEVAKSTTWERPFNNTYINFSRDHLPVYTKITDLVERTLHVAERAIFEAGGQKIKEADGVYYRIPCDF